MFQTRAMPRVLGMISFEHSSNKCYQAHSEVKPHVTPPADDRRERMPYVSCEERRSPTALIVHERRTWNGFNDGDE